MPNIASVLKDEVVRLARKEIRKEVEGFRKASAQYRSDIAALKRSVAALGKQVARLEKKAPGKVKPGVASDGTPRFRFSAKGFATQREKLGFSAADMGALARVSAQTIYNWEAGKSRPRQQQLAAIAALRKMGKREAQAQLANQTG